MSKRSADHWEQAMAQHGHLSGSDRFEPLHRPAGLRVWADAAEPQHRVQAGGPGRPQVIEFECPSFSVTSNVNSCPRYQFSGLRFSCSP